MEIKEDLDQELVEKIKSDVLNIEENHLHQLAPQGVVQLILSAVKHHVK